jgi:hypothetical protein
MRFGNRMRPSSIDVENDIAPDHARVRWGKRKYLPVIFGSMIFLHTFIFPGFLLRVDATEHSLSSISHESEGLSPKRLDEPAGDVIPETDDAFGFADDWEQAFAQTGGIPTHAMPLSWRLNTELKNYFPAEPDLQFRDADQKTEVMVGLDFSWAAAPYSLVTVAESYFLVPFFNEDIREDYAYSTETTLHRNLRITSRSSEIVLRELYIHRDGEHHRLRLGNQVFSWGTADFINPTAYVNPMDFREFIFMEEARSRFGIPSASAMFFLDEFTAELLFVPVHVPPALPSTGHVWAIKSIDTGFPVINNISVDLGDSDKLSVSGRNVGFGGRVSTTRLGVDASLSFYHGPDKDQLFVPYSVRVQENQPVLLMQPHSFISDYMGFDVALTHGDFVVQMEGAFSPNRRGIVRQNPDIPYELKFPYDTRKARFYAFSIGFNYFLPLHDIIAGHSGESLFTAEWYQAGYDADDISRPLFSDFLSLRYQDSYFDDRLKLSFTQLIAARNRGLIWWPKIGYNFHMGLKVELAYISIYGRGTGDFSRDSLFYHYRDNDFIMLTFRYDIQ